MKQSDLDIKVIRSKMRMDRIFKKHLENFYGVKNGNLQSEGGRQLVVDSQRETGEREEL